MTLEYISQFDLDKEGRTKAESVLRCVKIIHTFTSESITPSFRPHLADLECSFESP